MHRQSRSHRSSFARVVVVIGTLAVLSIPGTAVAQTEGPALIAPSAGLQAPPTPPPAPEAEPAPAPAEQANPVSENGVQADLRAWLQPYTQPRVFVTA